MSASKYIIDQIDSQRFIVFLVDLDGPKTITNDAESVVEEINERYEGYRIVYLATDGVWCELVHDCGVFRGFLDFP